MTDPTPPDAVSVKDAVQFAAATKARLRDVLKNKSVIGGLPDDALDDLIKRARVVRFARNEPVYRRGDPGDSLMIIVSGRVKISNIASSAREVVLNFLSAGDLNGELGALDGLERSADATALEATEALVVFRRDLLPVLERHPKALLEVVTALTGKLRAASAMVEHNLLQMPGKAASGLLRLADQHGRRTKDGVLIDLKLSQRDLGNYLGLSRENTSRELGRLKDAGLIRLDGASIVLLDADGLRACAEQETD
jgi:CRP/FNR family transcriptional regulator, cyclic AMP receptor protein